MGGGGGGGVVGGLGGLNVPHHFRPVSAPSGSVVVPT